MKKRFLKKKRAVDRADAQAQWAMIVRTLQSATLDDKGEVPRFVEVPPRNVADLQRVLDEQTDRFAAFLPRIIRLAYLEKEALKKEIRRAFLISTEPGRDWSVQMRQDMLDAVDRIPETPTYAEYPRFCLPGWDIRESFE